MKTICYCVLCMFFAFNALAQGWQKIASMPAGARDAAISFTIGNTLFCGGSGTTKDFYAYDAAARTWTKKANIPGVQINRWFAVGFAINSKGYVGLGTDHGADSLKNDLWEYDPIKDSWTQKADYPGGHRDGLGVFVAGNKAYVGGGSDNVYVYSQFYEYDPSNDMWTQKANIPESGDIFPSMFTIGNYGYAVCGAGASEYTDLFQYDPSSDSWSGLNSFPGEARQAAVSFVSNGKAYVGLGQSGYSKNYADMYSYDPVKDEWTKELSIPGTGRSWATISTVGDTAYIGNGAYFTSTSLNYLGDWWAYSPAFKSSVRSETTLAEDINCYPTPASTTINLTGLTPGSEYSFTIFNELGRQMKSEKISSVAGGDVSLDISKLPAGAYELVISHNIGTKTISLIKK